MTASLLKTASALALFAALGIGAAEAQQLQGRLTRQIVVEPAQAAATQAPAEATPAQDPAAAQASPAPEAPVATAVAPVPETPAAEPKAAEVTAALPAQSPVAAPVLKKVIKTVVVTKDPRPAFRHVGYSYGSGRGYSPVSYGRRNCH